MSMDGIESLWFYHLNNIGMKKIIITIISAMILMPSMADAQVEITKKSKTEILKSLRMGWTTLSVNDDIYALGLKSDNQFDKHYIIMLGEGKDNAIKSLETFIEIADTIKNGESMEFNNINETIRISKGLVKGEIWFKSKYYAGYGKTSKGELKTLMKALKK